MPNADRLARDCSFRNAEAGDQPLLWDMLFLAVYVPPGQTPPPRAIIALPELARYVRGWGRNGDLGSIAVDTATRQSIGAAWLRLFSDEERSYGFVDPATPELTVALLDGYRGRGVGTQLLQHLLARADRHFTRVSLSVTIGNPAARLYERLGFMPVSAPTPDAASMTLVRRRRERQ